MNERDIQTIAEVLEDYKAKWMAGEVTSIEDYLQKFSLNGELESTILENLQDVEWMLNTLEPLIKETLSLPDGMMESAWEKLEAHISKADLEQEIAGVVYAILVVSYILSRPYKLRHEIRAASENRLVYEKEDFRWEILQEDTKLIFSMATKKQELIEKYVIISIKSANKVDYPPEILQWKQAGPESIGSETPINTGGRVEIVIAETKLDMEKEEDFHLLEQIFEIIELRIFESRKQMN